MKIRNTVLAAALAASALLVGCGSASADETVPPPAPVVPAEGSPGYAGTCARFDGAFTVFQCVPELGPDGEVLMDIYEDGTGVYENGVVYAGSTHSFQPVCWDEPKPAPLATETICGSPDLAPANATNFRAGA